MKRKFICLIMVMTLAFADFSANANALTGDINVFVDKVAEMSAYDRANLITIIYPLVIIDDGVDTLIRLIDEYTPGSTGMIDSFIGQLLEYTTKEDIKFILRSVKVIPENIRQEYFGSFISRDGYELSSDGARYMSEFMDAVYGKYPKLEKVFKEDGITNETIANMFTAIPAVNDGVPVFNADSQYYFAPHYISDTVSDKWSALSLESGKDYDIEKSVIEICQLFNLKYSAELRKKIALLFSELGVCYLSSEKTVSYKNIVMADDARISYPAVYAYFKDGAMLFRTEIQSRSVGNILFNDIDGWYKDCVTELAYMGIVAGRGNGLFCPNDYVTREEFVKMICSAVNLPEIDAGTPFADVDNSAWYGRYIRTAYYYKIINGQSADAFGTGKYILRQDAAVICNNILKNTNTEKVADIVFGDDEKISSYARESVYNLAGVGVINGDNLGNFNATSNITRAESAKIINEIIYLIANAK